MRRRGIVFKLFIANLIFYVVFFAAVVAGHFWFFERFYQHERAGELEKKIADFAMQYNRQQWSADQIAPMMARFITQNHVQMTVLDKDGQVRFDNPFRILLRTNQGNLVPVALSFFPDISQIRAYHLQSGDHITVQGEFYDEQGNMRFSPYVIRKAGMHAVGALPNNVNTASLREISGSVESLLLPEPGQWNTREGIMAAALKEWMPLPAHYGEMAARGESFHFEWTEAVSGVHNLVFVQPVVRNGETEEYVFALTPLTQLGEAFGALEVYYAFFSIAGGLLLIVLLSFLFSKLVSRPLLQLNQTAGRMAQLDFSAVSDIRSKDELGSLSESLVSLSSNLNRTLQELRLTNEKLVREMEYKSRMEKLQKRFVSDASHELKTPISIVKGYAEGLLDHVAENKRDRYVRTIWQEADRMEKLVADMLELTRLESGAVLLNHSVFFVYVLAAELAEKMAPITTAKQLEVQMEGRADARVRADKGKIEQVLLNMLSNAIRHAAEGSVVRIGVEAEENARVRVSVANEGPPIPEEQLPLIWDRFYRGEDSRSRKAGGTGLGLSIVKEIMQLHGGRYGVRNIPGGVLFYFTLEFCPEDGSFGAPVSPRLG